MTHRIKQLWQKCRPRERRLLYYLLVVLAFAAWKLTPRYWKPAVTIETPHYIIASTATPEQTEEIGRVVEVLYNSYSNRFSHLPGFKSARPKLKLLLYKDREEFRRINPGIGWAEAFYKKPYCRAYYSTQEVNPYHWMLHEAVHQLNQEVAQFKLAKWIEEGLAEYFATSRIVDGKLALGRLDPTTYPLWWIEVIATTPQLETNLVNGTVIPLRQVISGSGGPRLNSNVNLYYLHWWSLTHFLFEHPQYREKTVDLLQRGAGLQAFEQLIGQSEAVEVEWHQHVQRIKTAMSGNDLEFHRTGTVTPPAPLPR